jgi:PAS domain S-box-containing protein
MKVSDSFSLFDSVKAVRELMQRKLENGGEAAHDELLAGLQEIDALWEELRSQSQELASERQRYSEFFDYAPDAYFVTDCHGVIQEANRAAAELLNVSARALAGKPLMNYVPEEAKRDFRARVVRASAQPAGEVSAWRSALQPREGKSLPVQLRVRAMPVAGGGLAPLCWLVQRGE